MGLHLLWMCMIYVKSGLVQCFYIFVMYMVVIGTWSGCLGRFFDSGTDLGSFDSITHHSGHDLTTYCY